MQETFYTVPGCPVLIALVSDLHERPYEAVLASLRKNRPDLICVAGDFFLGVMPKTLTKAEESGMLPFFSACAEFAPCFVSLGNHEWMIQPEDIALINETGARVLDNTFTAFDIGGTLLTFGGLSSARVSACQLLYQVGFDVRSHALYYRTDRDVPVVDWFGAF